MIHTHSHFGVYAVIFDVAQTSILLIKKARGPYTGLYDLPGGSPEAEELLEETLQREVLEETGCTVISSRQLGGVSARFDYQKDGAPALLRHIGIIYAAEISGDIRLIGDGEDSLGCVWLPIKNIEEEKVTPFVLSSLKLAKNS